MTSLEEALKSKDNELKKNSYIDSLKDVSDSVRRELKRRVSVNANTENMEEVVTQELDAIQELLQDSTPKATDTRPYSVGDKEVDATDARAILQAEGREVEED